MTTDRIVSIAFLTQAETDRLSNSLARCYPLEDDGMFDHLLAQLDNVEIEPLGKGVVIRPVKAG